MLFVSASSCIIVYLLESTSLFIIASIFFLASASSSLFICNLKLRSSLLNYLINLSLFIFFSRAVSLRLIVYIFGSNPENIKALILLFTNKYFWIIKKKILRQVNNNIADTLTDNKIPTRKTRWYP